MDSNKNCEIIQNTEMHKTEDLNTVAKNEKNDEIADFEKAINAAGFGKFNLYLIMICVPAICATNFATTTMSFILPVAECDLKLSLQDKGILNAATYVGMILSALIWGYLADTQGRKKLLVFCYLADGLCVFASSLSQNTEMLITFKFLGGFMANGPSAILYTYIAEMHSLKYRSRAVMVIGLVMSFAALLLPLLAWAIFPRNWDFLLFNLLTVHSWQIFLFICMIPSLLGGFLIIFLPESPKFLMAQGRNAEAMRTFQKIYKVNTGRARSDYPIKELVEEVPSRESNPNEFIYTIEANKSNKKKLHKKIKPPSRTISESIHDGMLQMKPLFQKPLLGHALHVVAMQFCILLSLNTIRLWLPQLFASISEYEAIKSPEDSANLCSILEFSVNKTAATINDYEDRCAVRPTFSMDTYINNIIVGLSGMVGYALGGFIVRAIGGKRIMIYGLFLSSCLSFCLYWSINGLSTLIISAAFLTISSISTMSLVGAIAELFPTSLRTIILASSLMFGRLGAVSGNMLFPVLVKLGCIQPFVMVSLMMLCASVLACLLPGDNQ